MEDTGRKTGWGVRLREFSLVPLVHVYALLFQKLLSSLAARMARYVEPALDVCRAESLLSSSFTSLP